MREFLHTTIEAVLWWLFIVIIDAAAGWLFGFNNPRALLQTAVIFLLWSMVDHKRQLHIVRHGAGDELAELTERVEELESKIDIC